MGKLSSLLIENDFEELAHKRRRTGVLDPAAVTPVLCQRVDVTAVTCMPISQAASRKRRYMNENSSSPVTDDEAEEPKDTVYIQRASVLKSITKPTDVTYPIQQESEKSTAMFRPRHMLPPGQPLARPPLLRMPSIMHAKKLMPLSKYL